MSVKRQKCQKVSPTIAGLTNKKMEVNLISPLFIVLSSKG